MDPTHEPVLVAETVALLEPSRGGLFVDCTVGLGGHARALLAGGRDAADRSRSRHDALRDCAREALAPWRDRVELVHADYRELPRVLAARGIDGIDGALADLGVSSMQFDAEGRGFSFRRDEPLDMRMDQTQGPTAAELRRRRRRRGSGERDLPVRRGALLAPHRARDRRGAREPRRSRPPASSPRSSAARFRARATSGSIRRRARSRRCASGSTASSTGWTRFSSTASRLLGAGARLAVITFHSLEDRIVKHVFRALAAGEDALRVLTRKPVVPGEDGSGAQPARAQRKAARD